MKPSAPKTGMPAAHGGQVAGHDVPAPPPQGPLSPPQGPLWPTTVYTPVCSRLRRQENGSARLHLASAAGAALFGARLRSRRGRRAALSVRFDTGRGASTPGAGVAPELGTPSVSRETLQLKAVPLRCPRPICWVTRPSPLADLAPCLLLPRPFSLPVRYAANGLLSGYASQANIDALQGQGVVFAERRGSGSVILFADNPYYRAYFRGSARVFTNAIFFGDSFRNASRRGE